MFANFKMGDDPAVLDIKRGSLLNKKCDCLHVLVACSECGKQRWVRSSEYKRKPEAKCRSCSAREVMIHMPKFQGIRQPKHSQGYRRIWVHPKDIFHSMADKSHYVMEHRMVMAVFLDRLIHSYETVHHKNGIRDDNRIENLELWTGKHGRGVRVSDIQHCPTCTCAREGS